MAGLVKVLPAVLSPVAATLTYAQLAKANQLLARGKPVRGLNISRKGMCADFRDAAHLLELFDLRIITSGPADPPQLLYFSGFDLLDKDDLSLQFFSQGQILDGPEQPTWIPIITGLNVGSDAPVTQGGLQLVFISGQRFVKPLVLFYLMVKQTASAHLLGSPDRLEFI